MNHTILFICVLLSALSFAHSQANIARPGTGDFKGFKVVKVQTRGPIDVIDARKYSDRTVIPGVGISKECLVKLDNIAWQVNFFFR